MYSVYLDYTLMYSDQRDELEYKLIDAKLNLEDNSAGTFTITIPVTNGCYSKIKKMYSHIVVYRNNEKLWGGRPVTEEYDFDMNKVVTCEGELAYLNDTYQPGQDWIERSVISVREYIDAILSVHNNKCNASRNFSLPSPTDHTGPLWADYNKYYSTSYNPEFTRITSFQLGTFGNNDISTATATSNPPYDIYATQINGRINVPTLTDTSDNYKNYCVQFENYLSKYISSDSTDGNRLRVKMYKYRFFYRLSDGSFNGLSEEFVSDASYIYYLPDKSLTNAQIQNSVRMEVCVQVALTDEEIERRNGTKTITNTDIGNLNSGDNFFTYRVLGGNLAFNDSLYNRILFRRGAFSGHSLGSVFVSGGEYVAYATQQGSTALTIPTLSSTDDDYNRYAIHIKAFPFLYEYDSATTYNNKKAHYKYRILYKLSSASTTNYSDWCTDPTFYFRFPSTKLTQTDITNHVVMQCGIEVTKLDGTAMSTSGDIAYLNTGINYVSVRMLDNTNLDTIDGPPSLIDHQDKRIYTGAIFFTEDLPSNYEFVPYISTFEAIKKLVDKFGGHIRVRTGSDGKYYLDYLQDYINTNTQTIELGRNLLDYTQNYDLSKLCTVLLPLGKKKDEGNRVGKEIDVHWNENSAIESNGAIRYGKYFHITNEIAVIHHETEEIWEGSTHRSQQRDTKLYFIGEQINGYTMYAFYDENHLKIKTYEANDGAHDSQNYTSWTEIQIPTNAKWVVFGFYYGGSGDYTPFTSASEGPDAFDDNQTYDTVFRIKYDSLSVKYEYTMNDASRDIHIEVNKVINSSATYHEDKEPYGTNYVVSDPITVPVLSTDKENYYYYTSRMNRGLGIYAIHGPSDRPIASTKTATSGETYSDNKKEKITLPPGSRKLYVAGIKNVDYDPHVYYDEALSSDTYYDPPKEYVTIAEVNNGSLYLEHPDMIREYGWIEKSKQWDEADTPSKLKVLANEYMLTSQWDDMTLELTALDLNVLDADVEAIDILDQIRCVSNYHGLDRYFPVTAIELPLLNPEAQKFTLGLSSTIESISNNTVTDANSIYEAIEDLPTPSSVLRQARTNATEIMNLTNNGFVDVSGSEILIMDAPSKDIATRMWRLNVNGVGYSSNGYAGPFGLAFTMDGAIVADRITTGYMHADRIRGGSLTLGGYDGVDGEFHMLNKEGKEFIKMTYEGAEFLASISTVFEREKESRYTNRDTHQEVVETQSFYGMASFDGGKLIGYTAGINESPFTSDIGQDFTSRQIAFSDITSKSKLTEIDMACLLKLNGADGYGHLHKGIYMDSAEAFLLELTGTNAANNMSLQPDGFEVWRNGTHINAYSTNDLQYISSITADGNGGFTWTAGHIVITDGMITSVNTGLNNGSGGSGGGNNQGGFSSG